MSFLTPLYIAGLAAVSLPVLFHLIRRRPRGRVPFSTLMFLKPSPPRITRRSRLDNWPLLLLRALAVCLLAAAFARPFLREAVGTGVEASDGRHIAIVIDVSASMRRGDLFERARKLAVERVQRVSPDDRVAVYTFDRRLHAVVGFDEWSRLPAEARREVAGSRIAKLQPGWAATDLGAALTAAVDALASRGIGSKEDGRRSANRIVLISDLQRGSQTDALQTYQWPQDVSLQVEAVGSTKTTNAGLHLIGPDDDATGGSEQFVRIRVSNSADATREQFRVRWADGDAASARRRESRELPVYVPPGTVRTFRVPVDDGMPLPAHLVLDGDDHTFDNTAVFDRPETQSLTVVYAGDDEPDDPDGLRYFVERAFPENRLRRVQVVSLRAAARLFQRAGLLEAMPLPSTPATPAAGVLLKEGDALAGQSAPDTRSVRGTVETVPLTIVARTLRAEHHSALHRYCRQGGTVLFVAQTADTCRAFGRFVGIEGLQADEAEVDGYAMLGEIDFDHPLFAPFADSRYSDFTRLHFWRYRKLDESQLAGCRVLARFDDGSPALIAADVEKGTALLLTSGWHPDDSQLALSTKFVPLMNAMLELGVGGREIHRRYVVGDLVPTADVLPASRRPPLVRTPENHTIRLASGQQSFEETVRPGVYRVENQGTRTEGRSSISASREANGVAAKRSEGEPDGSVSPGEPDASASPGEPDASASGSLPAGLRRRLANARFTVHVAPEESLTSPLPVEHLEALGVRTESAAGEDESEAAIEQRERQLKAVEIENRQKLWRWLLVAALAVLLVETWMAGRLAHRRFDAPISETNQ